MVAMVTAFSHFNGDLMVRHLRVVSCGVVFTVMVISYSTVYSCGNILKYSLESTCQKHGTRGALIVGIILGKFGVLLLLNGGDGVQSRVLSVVGIIGGGNWEGV